MSNDSLDEETKRILSEVNADAEINKVDTDDSKESKSEDKKKNGRYEIEWETNTEETPDSEW